MWPRLRRRRAGSRPRNSVGRSPQVFETSADSNKWQYRSTSTLLLRTSSRRNTAPSATAAATPVTPARKLQSAQKHREGKAMVTPIIPRRRV
jgi:hypothetical protein